MNPDGTPDEPGIEDLLAAATHASAEQAQAALALASTLWHFHEALTASGFQPEPALALTLEYFRLLWANAARPAAQQPKP